MEISTNRVSLIRTNAGPHHIRWMVARDMREVLAIDELASRAPWTAEDYDRRRREPNVIGMIADEGDDVAGFMIYRLDRREIALERLIVHPGRRRRGAGRAMVEKLVGKLSMQRRTRLRCLVRESELESLAFAKATGWRAVGLIRDWYESPADDAIELEIRLRGGVI